jgi:hypothetical protein
MPVSGNVIFPILHAFSHTTGAFLHDGDDGREHPGGNKALVDLDFRGFDAGQ